MLQRALERRRLLVENRELRQVAAPASATGRLVGQSAPMRRLFREIEKVAGSDATVLISGESGTGKELVARAIHAGSPRRDRAFVAVNASALPESLAEAELFGHEKGAFTGAIASRPGRFELAQGGTLFLDEIGTLSPAVQSKLLRALESREIERVGGRRTDSRRLSPHLGHQREPGSESRRRDFPRGPLLSDPHRSDRDPAIARAGRRHSACSSTTFSPDFWRVTASRPSGCRPGSWSA